MHPRNRAMRLSSNSDRRGDASIMFARRKRFKSRDGSRLKSWHGSCCVRRGTRLLDGANMARKYSKKASKKVEKVMRERKRGTLRSGRSGRKVTSRKQAIAIGLSEARREGAKVPAKPARRRAKSARTAKASKTTRARTAR